MKSRRAFLVISIVILIDVSSCVAALPGINSLTVYFDLAGSKDARAIAEDFNQVASGKVFLKQGSVLKNQADLMINVDAKTGTGTLSDSPPGDYNIVLELYDITRKLLYDANSTVTIVAGDNGTKTMTLSKCIATVDITGTWDETVTDLKTATVELKQSGTTKYTMSLGLNINAKTANCKIGNVYPGSYEVYVVVRGVDGVLKFEGTQTVAVIRGANSFSIHLDVKTGSIAITMTGDATAPAITNGPTCSVSGTTATITWETSEPATSAVCYSVTSGFDYQSSLNWAPLGGDLTANMTSHSVVISGLIEGSTYYYVVVSADAAGNLTVSDEYELVETSFSGQEIAKLMAIDGTSGDRFGTVSISGDNAIIGAYTKGEGAAYIFNWNGTNWIEKKKLLAGDGGARFGLSVSIDANNAIVGSDQDSDLFTWAGAAYVYHWNGTDWIQQAKLTASDAEAYDEFGYGAAIDGNYSIVGAPASDDFGSESGSAYIFFWNNSEWIQQAKLLPSDGSAMDNFGTHVDIDGDYAIVGSHYDDEKGSNSGAAYIFKRNGQNWSQISKLTANDGVADQWFGWSVSIDGPYAVVGADRYSGSTLLSSAYVFINSQDTWTQQTKLVAADGFIGDDFAESVAIYGDYIAIGASSDNDHGSSSGSLYLFMRDGVNWSLVQKIIPVGVGSGDEFGSSVSIGSNWIIIGAFADDGLRGSAYIFH